jgi:hypothetical protein
METQSAVLPERSARAVSLFPGSSESNVSEMAFRFHVERAAERHGERGTPRGRQQGRRCGYTKMREQLALFVCLWKWEYFGEHLEMKGTTFRRV